MLMPLIRAQLENRVIHHGFADPSSAALLKVVAKQL